MLAVEAAANGAPELELAGEKRVLDLAARFGIPAAQQSLAEVAREVVAVLLEDLGRMHARPLRTLEAFAPPERKDVWRALGVLPRSASYEIVEALHMTTLGGCSDWIALAEQQLRAALAYCYGPLFGSSLATEMLFGVPEPRTTTVNYGVLKHDHVNVLIHGHSPVMVGSLLEKLRSPEIEQLARDRGAKGIVVGGLCCSGEELLARHGVPSVTNAGGQELVLGTGAVDAMVVDMQCVIPGTKILADCFGTQLITTCRSNRIPGALHVPFDAEKPETIEADALTVARAAVEAFARRDRSKMSIPEVRTSATAGWSYENVLERFGGARRIVELLKSGSLNGIAAVVGCNTPKVPYERGHVTVAERLVEADVLVLTTGCSAHALLNYGLCDPAAARSAGPGLSAICRELEIPPALAMGGCMDNTRSLRLFIEIAREAGVPMKDLPLLFVCPEPGNEKAVGQGLAFLMHGVSALIGFPFPIPPARSKADDLQAAEFGSDDVLEFLSGAEGLAKLVGAKVFTEPEPAVAAKISRLHLEAKRVALGWPQHSIRQG
jgi:carbon-monoxide dehydrogenase catalytic subunit